MADDPSLEKIFDGWVGYQTSLVHALAPLTPEQLAWKPADHLRSAGELAAHIIVGRVSWFERMGAPGSARLAEEAAALGSDEVIAGDAAQIVNWLEASWSMIENTLKQWTTADLGRTYAQPYQDQIYAVPFQWTIWRVVAHDLHHGGELAVTLGMQGIELPELGDLGGHITMPPLTEEM